MDSTKPKKLLEDYWPERGERERKGGLEGLGEREKTGW